MIGNFIKKIFIRNFFWKEKELSHLQQIKKKVGSFSQLDNVNWILLDYDIEKASNVDDVMSQLKKNRLK